MDVTQTVVTATQTVEDKPPRKKKLSAEDMEKFAKKLKDSVVHKSSTITNEQLPAETDKRAEQLREFHAALKSNERQETYIKCLMGRNLLEIKNSSHMKGKQFIDYVTPYLPKHYGRSDIYFMMNLYKLADEYNALMYVTLGTGVLKSRLKQVEEVLRKEPDFWKHIPSGRSSH
jgi:hypothetical protein